MVLDLSGEQGHDMQRRGFGSDGNRDGVMAHRFPTRQSTMGFDRQMHG